MEGHADREVLECVCIVMSGGGHVARLGRELSIYYYYRWVSWTREGR